MAINYSFPSTEEVREIDPLLLDEATRDDPVFEMFPIVRDPADRLVWEQRDSYRGLQQVRGLNGEPPRVVPVGARRFSMEPGVYGEFMDVDEHEMTRRAASFANTDTPVDIDDLVVAREQQLVVRETNRMRWIAWQLLTRGLFVVLNEHGAILHADAFDMQTFTSTVAWTTVATATPIADFRQVARLPRGTSASLGSNAIAWMNQITFDNLISNTNAADLGGQKTINQNRVRSLDDANAMMLTYGLPEIRIYDEGYLDDSGVWQVFIPDNRVVVTGRRTNGAALGEFRITRNVNNPGATADFYNKVIDFLDMKVPRKIEVHRGWNGGIALFYPGAVATMVVA